MATRQFEILLNGVHDSSGEPLGSGKVYTYIAGTTTLATTYVDKDSLTPASNPILLDSNGTAQVYGDGVYKLIIKDVNDVTLYTYDNIFIGVTDSQLKNSGTSTGSANAYVLTNDIPSTAYAVLDTYRFIANFANTGVATVNIDGLGVKNIKRYDGTNLSSGDIAINSFNEIVYNGTNFLLATNGTALSSSIAGLQTTLTAAIQNSSYVWGGTSGGSANAQTLSLTPTLTSYPTGLEVRFKAGFSNTGTCTLNINSLGAKSIKRQSSSADLANLSSGDIKLDQIHIVIYDGVNFQLINRTI